jgi:hypothetical protein
MEQQTSTQDLLAECALLEHQLRLARNTRHRINQTLNVTDDDMYDDINSMIAAVKVETHQLNQIITESQGA